MKSTLEPQSEAKGGVGRGPNVYSTAMTTWLKWIGTTTAASGALWVALNLPSSGWAFVLFTVSSVCWTTAGWRMREPSLVLLHSLFFAINIVGIYRWLLV